MARQIAMGTPARLQRRRIKGWRAPEGAVYVGRGSAWGNPYRLGDTQVRMPGIDGSEWQHEGRLGKTSGQQHAFVHPDGSVTWHLVQDATPEQVVELYRRWLAKHPAHVAAVREQLAGRDLMCWCPLPAPGQPDHCHASVLLRIAAGGGRVMDTGLCLLIALCIGLAAIAWALQPPARTRRGPWADQRRGGDQ